MKLSPMTSRDRRALMLGALVAVPGLLFPLVVKPYLRTLAAVRQETAEQRDLLGRERRAIAATPALPAARARATQQLGIEVRRLFQGSDELIATGNLAQYVAGAAQDAGLRLEQSETRPSHTVVPGVQALQVELRAEGDLEGVLRFLRQLESGGKLVRIGTLSIEGGRDPLNAPANNLTRRGLLTTIGGGLGGFSGSPMGGAGGGGRRRRRAFGGGDINGPLGGAGSVSDMQLMSLLQQAVVTGETPVQVVSQAADSTKAANGGAASPKRSGSVEVLSLSASVYGYRLTSAPWASAEPHADGAPSPFHRIPYALESSDAVLDHDPFNAARTRPSMSYRAYLLAVRDSASRPVPERRPERHPEQLRLLGTVTGSPGASFAVCQVGNTPPQTVHVGERIAGYTLTSLHHGTAAFTTAEGGELTLQVTQPGSSQ